MPQLKDTRLFAIVENGVVTSQVVGASIDKFELVCKRNFRSMVWADCYTAKKRKVDPAYVVFRGNGREPRCMLILIENAPDNWLDEIRSLYWKDLSFAP